MCNIVLHVKFMKQQQQLKCSLYMLSVEVFLAHDVLLLPLPAASWNTWLQSPKDAKESGMRKGQALCANIQSQVRKSKQPH
jgi:hypothetical protein